MSIEEKLDVFYSSLAGKTVNERKIHNCLHVFEERFLNCYTHDLTYKDGIFRQLRRG